MTRRLAPINFLLASIGGGVTYGMMLEEAYLHNDWIHIVTLTPLFPYVVAAGLAARHRRRPRCGVVIAVLIVISAAIGWPLFWNYYLPGGVRSRTKVLVKIVLPVCQGAVVILAGVVMELLTRQRSERRPSEWPVY